ncbi:MAG: hypothetical protein U0X73_05555 [Thermoanaerobaculia bacterium]
MSFEAVEPARRRKRKLVLGKAALRNEVAKAVGAPETQAPSRRKR